MIDLGAFGDWLAGFIASMPADMAAVLAVWWWFLDPLHGTGYLLWSGIGIVPLAWLAGLFTFYRSHNCHVRRCPRIQWHEVELPDGRIFRVCKRHHPDGETGCPPPTASAPRDDA